ncbi:hypothetical protein KP509_26G021100 [Ceratopteris richardii]|uniref:Uncharacterized protein n=1 Tax=Ceratopteris richardii TaxID=49495 RepID=A0A8T2RJ04_CERRI|nr:hypothetical protein KP509_26G021100 [Ceratopteris richardii]
MRECKDCVLQNLKMCSNESTMQVIVIGLKRLAYEKEINKNRRIFKRKLLKSKMKSVIIHNYVARWQAQHFKYRLQKYQDDVIVSVINFAKNYTFKEKNGIQSMHFHSSQMNSFFFGTGHGKGEHDNARIVSKRTLTWHRSLHHKSLMIKGA